MADNDPDFLETRREFLEKEGYQVIAAFSPLEAEEKLQQEQIDFAIIDIRLSNDDDEKDVSGLELAKNVEYPLPILILTGYPVAVEYVRQALTFQANGIPLAHDFLAKEEGPKALLTAVRSALEIAERQKGMVAHNAVITERTPPRLSAFKRWKPILASVALLLALGTGVIATVYGDPRWLIGTVGLAVLAVFFVGLLE
jgi:CheY-like chemotaxis protein